MELLGNIFHSNVEGIHCTGAEESDYIEIGNSMLGWEPHKAGWQCDPAGIIALYNIGELVECEIHNLSEEQQRHADYCNDGTQDGPQ